MNEERFDQSADMRLVDLRREQLGIAKPLASEWSSKASADLPFGPIPEPEAIEAGPLLTLQTTATPDAGLIPGAVVTLGLSVVNEGMKAAHGAALRLPLPSAMEYRPGSLEIDGRKAPDDAWESLFGKGLEIGTLAGAQRVTILVKLTVKTGLEGPVVSPSLTSTDAAVVGAKALRLERASGTRTAFSANLARTETEERPFYELEPEEAIVYEAVDTALSPAVPAATVRPPAPPPPPPPVKAKAVPVQPKPAPAKAPAKPAPAAAKAASPGWAAVAPERLTDPTLATTVARTKLSTLTQFFAANRSFGMVAHYLLLSALACSRTLPAEASAAELATFFGAQDALLTKALIAKRLGKNVALGDVGAPLPAFPPRFPTAAVLPTTADPAVVFLYRSFTPNELDFVGRAVANAASPPFTRAGQLSVGLCANRVVTPDGARSDACERALTEYAAGASSEINRLFVRARLDKRTDLFGASSPDLDARARAVLGALSALDA